jgi:2-C-methyl-D-erythritol 4-phosphate cytidylyltransferase
MAASHRGGVAMIVVAAGSGVRMMAPVNKIFLRLGGQPILQRTLEALSRIPAIDQIVTVASAADRERCETLIRESRISTPHRLVNGGATRHASEFNGLLALAADIESGRLDVVLVHDAVRPFVDEHEVEELIVTARRTGAALPMIPAGDHLVTVDAQGGIRRAEESLWLAQTPQAFNARIVLEAHRRAAEEAFAGTDTASVVEHAGHAVAMVVGRRENIKITTTDDLLLAELIVAGSPRDGTPVFG